MLSIRSSLFNDGSVDSTVNDQQLRIVFKTLTNDRLSETKTLLNLIQIDVEWNGRSCSIWRWSRLTETQLRQTMCWMIVLWISLNRSDRFNWSYFLLSNELAYSSMTSIDSRWTVGPVTALVDRRWAAIQDTNVSPTIFHSQSTTSCTAHHRRLINYLSRLHIEWLVSLCLSLSRSHIGTNSNRTSVQLATCVFTFDNTLDIHVLCSPCLCNGPSNRVESNLSRSCV
jgi:hypothetical protein